MFHKLYLSVEPPSAAGVDNPDDPTDPGLDESVVKEKEGSEMDTKKSNPRPKTLLTDQVLAGTREGMALAPHRKK